MSVQSWQNGLAVCTSDFIRKRMHVYDAEFLCGNVPFRLVWCRACGNLNHCFRTNINKSVLMPKSFFIWGFKMPFRQLLKSPYQYIKNRNRIFHELKLNLRWDQWSKILIWQLFENSIFYLIGSFTPKINIHLMAYKKKQTVRRCLPSKTVIPKVRRTVVKVWQKLSLTDKIILIVGPSD
jgi:hypothetical protein